MESKKIKIKIASEKYVEDGVERTETVTDAELLRDGEKTSIVYSEGESSGMQGAKTRISFSDNAPTIVTMKRGGAGFVSALVFDEGKKNTCVYHTPIMSFDIDICATSVENRLLDEGYIALDYVIEIRGADAERNCVRVSVVK